VHLQPQDSVDKGANSDSISPFQLCI
jgi:hypothetical protein